MSNIKLKNKKNTIPVGDSTSIDDLKNNDNIKNEDLQKTVETMIDADNSERPYPIIGTDGKMTVVGNANDIERNADDYRINFMIRKDMVEEIPNFIKEGTDFYLVQEIYKNKYLTPMLYSQLEYAFVTVLQVCVKDVVSEDGKTKELIFRDHDEIAYLIATAKDDVISIMYSIVAKFLNVERELIEYMMIDTVMESFEKIVKNHPEMINDCVGFTSQP